MKYVIIGNSAAGIGAAEGIRQIDKSGEITVIASEPHHTYSRPLISYLLRGKVTEEGMKYRSDNFYNDNNISLLSGVTVVKIEAEKKQLTLTNGKNINYDKLLVASGSVPFVPPFEGLGAVKNKFTFMCLDDARQLDKTLSDDAFKNGAKVLIIGAGLIGLKCAEGIINRVSEITVTDIASGILQSILDEKGAAIVQKHIEKQGVRFMLKSGVKKFENDCAAGAACAVFEDGRTVNFDILVLAVGVRPNTSLLKGVADIERGVIVNNKSETSAQDIYSAGDCTQTLDISSGQSKIMALLPNAYMQGECAGINMAGGEFCFNKAIPMNAISFFGLHMITAGNYAGDTYFRNVDKEPVAENFHPVCSGESYKKLFYSDNRLNGYILIGNVEKAGIYTSLIREQTPLDSIDFALICERPGLMAFSKEERVIKLGGVS